jgi:MFS family permease
MRYRGAVTRAPHASTPPRRAAFGVLTLGSSLNFTSRGMAESFVVFVLPLAREFGWDRGAVMSIQAIGLASSGAVAPLCGRGFDRYGPRLVFGLGLALLGIGFTLAASADQLWQFQLCIGLGCGIGVACLGNVPNAALVARWFRTRLGFAMSVLFAGGGIGILVLVPLAQLLVGAGGWSAAYRWLGLGVLALLLPVLLLPWQRIAIASHDAARAAADDGPTLRAALRQQAFWGLFAVFLFSAIGMHGTAVQVVAYLVEAGFAPLTAASAWGFSGVLLPLGMVLFGWLDGRIGRRPSVFLSYAVSMVGVGLLWLIARQPSELLLAGAVLMFGGTIGSRGPLISALAMEQFRGQSAGTIFGCITLGQGLGAGLGTWIGGVLHDWSGGYDLWLGTALVSILFGMLPFLILPSLRR